MERVFICFLDTHVDGSRHNGVFENGYFRSVLQKLWHTGNNLTIVAMLREQLVSTCTDLLDEYKKTVCNG